MEMPVVNRCEATSCVYNRDRRCHATAITVGDLSHAHCDTFFTTAGPGGDQQTVGRVGACKMYDCRHNVALECQAPGIDIGYVQDEADCMTYAPA
ncbi:DUF1540 domain-containing protein [Microbispora sp. H10670]|uniref:DUF1540 domain-containing protein n=1 Tax=unclassified Microbispora TaxID=2614687 RepID=UPI0015FF19C8|nr:MULTISPECIES: DUF1540 domain-containing protein [unclassified Microbispora]